MRPRERVARAAAAVLKRVARARGYDLVPRDIYSPIPDVPPEHDPLWESPASLVGVEFDLDEQLRLLETELRPYLAEFSPPATAAAEDAFYVWNGYYQAVDADVLYAMVRHLKPRRILEIGSGYSTLVTAAACSRNRGEGHASVFTAVDPGPRAAIKPPPDGPDRFLRTTAQELPLETFLELGRGDLLFVDSSHAVKLGSDVNFLVLEVLPRLRPGVVVHFHDIFLPYEYPRDWYERGTFVAEQYLLHAFLIDSTSYEVFFAAHAVARAHRDRLAELIPSLGARSDHYPAAFWMLRTCAPGPGSGTGGRS
ncbi:MAG: class I SAM-dependent methyltransferase [Actinomycetota bacterium]|nr:class I SAM-dependent methyltransferase [Actinomycetota bacterium]